MRTVIAISIVIYSCIVSAVDKTDMFDECVSMENDTKRLACYDNSLKLAEPEAPSKKVDPIPVIRFRVLQKGDYDNFAKADITAKPATFDLQRKDGQDGSRVQLGVIAVGSAFNDAGWQAFGSLAWNRDTTGDVVKRKELRDAGIGVTGALLQSNDVEWSLYTTLHYRHRQDSYGSKDGNAFGIHGNVVKLGWVDAKPFIFVPYAGILLDNRNGGGTTDGRWNSAYIGAILTIPLSNWIQGLSVSGTFERFHDYSAPNGQLKRSASSSSPSITYEFTDPEDKKAKWRPSISLTRQVGEDVRTGGNRENKTMLSFGLKYN